MVTAGACTGHRRAPGGRERLFCAVSGVGVMHCAVPSRVRCTVENQNVYRSYALSVTRQLRCFHSYLLTYVYVDESAS